MNDRYKYFDFGSTLEEMMGKAREFGERMRDAAREQGWDARGCYGNGEWTKCFHGSYSYPPTNIYKASDGTMVLEFALAGIREDDVSISFHGDWLVLKAKAEAAEGTSEAGNFARRGFRPRDIDRQKYHVPAQDYDQAQARASFRNGVLTVRVPRKDEPEDEGIRVEIKRESI